MAIFIHIISLLATLTFITNCHFVEAKKHSSKSSLALTKCQADECELSPEHFALYSTIKRAIESNFDLNGKHILPLVRSIEVLKRRFLIEDAASPYTRSTTTPKGIDLVRGLIANETLIELLQVLQTDDGRALTDLYRSSINGKSQNLACSQFRIQQIEWASNKLSSNKRLAAVFNNIHNNFLKKSAKKCLKTACNSVDTSMTKLDSVLGKLSSKHNSKEESNNFVEGLEDEGQKLISDAKATNKREFESEELELCRFFRKTNSSDCIISGSELMEINLSPKGGDAKDEPQRTTNKTFQDNKPILNDLLRAYYGNRLKPESQTNSSSLKPGVSQVDDKQEFELEESSRAILAQCRPLRSLLSYNLAALEWYKRQNLVDEQKLSTRTFWCPSLRYWLQLNRLCGELEASIIDNSSGTFSYEVSASGKSVQHTLV